ncbi:MAG: glycosyltransferase family 1 protein [Patescibacteria group bacterium]
MIKRIGIECRSIEDKNPDLPAGRQVWGVGRIIMKLLEELSRRPELEKNFRFILYFKGRVPDFAFLNAPIFEKKTVPVPFFKNRLFPVYYFALLPIKLWLERLDLMFWPDYMLPIIAFNKSLVMLTEDVYYETHEGKLPFRYRLAYGIFGWWTAKFATKILAISETSKKNIAKLYNINPNRIAVSYPGIDLNKIENLKLKIENYSYILYVGQAFPRRHLKETILAFEKIAPAFPELKLIAVGPDKYESPVIKSLVTQVNDRLNREAVVHKDYVEDGELVELYAGAKALIYVSDREAFGLPPMEVLSFGVPPVIADNELGHELFGEYAFYVGNPTPDGIAEGIRQALTQTEKITKIKTAGPEFVKKYSWKSFTDKFLEKLVVSKSNHVKNIKT